MTKVALISDVHANHNALFAVSRYARDGLGIREFWMLGDLLGYGPRARLAWGLMEELNPTVWLYGNHDWYIAHAVSSDFNGDQPAQDKFPDPFLAMKVNGKEVQVKGPNWAAWDVAKLHHQDLSGVPDIWDRLSRLDLVARPHPNIFCAHGVYAEGQQATTKARLETYTYQVEDLIGASVFHFSNWQAAWRDVPADVPILHIVGHTHIPALWERAWATGQNDWIRHEDPDQEPVPDKAYNLKPGYFYHINPGSVGFPRGRSCCPCLAVLDLDAWTVTFHEVKDANYKVEQVRKEMEKSGYPTILYSERVLKPCAVPDEED